MRLPAALTKVRELCLVFGPNPEVPEAQEIPPEAVPEPYHRLLVHEHHMTVTMEQFHRSPMQLRIVEESLQRNLYARKILLAAEKTKRVVQFGIMRFNFDCCSDSVREKVLEGIVPLGRILIQHNLLRRIDVHYFLKLQAAGELARLFELSSPAETYGRVATIFCNERPAVELLEISAPVF